MNTDIPTGHRVCTACHGEGGTDRPCTLCHGRGHMRGDTLVCEACGERAAVTFDYLMCEVCDADMAAGLDALNEGARYYVGDDEGELLVRGIKS